MEELPLLPLPRARIHPELRNVRSCHAPAFGVAKRDTKTKGDLAELRALSAFAQAGYLVSIPFGENHRYDFIADDGERLLRVQVKTGRLDSGVVKYACSSAHGHRGGGMRPYFGQIDLLAVFCPHTDKVYVLPESELTATFAHLRVDPTKNGMRKGIRWARDYEL